ncbi:MAG: aminodeoxychorismate/anthranilate synthase component II [Thermodesulfobacteriota bacterium]|nr:aminodeoxychorismate/anthranilate synthase component II [Thermodesulfobacteriota bacterium]
MILMIDNYDSFTFNLVQYLGELGEEVITYRNDKTTLEKIERLSPQYIVISPGPGIPRHAGLSVEIIRTFSGKIPILGVCLGHQAVGDAFGGKVVGAKHIMHGKTSQVTHNEKGIFDGIPNPFVATRYHSLVIDKNTLPDCFDITAESEDGEIMGVKHKKYSVNGVQFHPESILTGEGKNILKNFLTKYHT